MGWNFILIGLMFLASYSIAKKSASSKIKAYEGGLIFVGICGIWAFSTAGEHLEDGDYDPGGNPGT